MINFSFLSTGCMHKKNNDGHENANNNIHHIIGFNKNGCCLIAGSTDVSSSESRDSICLPTATVAYAESAHKIITTKIAAQVNNVTKTILSFLCSIVRQLPFYAIIIRLTRCFMF